MKTFIADIIPKIQQYSDKLDNLSLLTNQHWVLIDNIEKEKKVYLFRPNSELLISRNGKVEKYKWEYLGNKSLIIDLGVEAYLFKHGFFDENLLALKIDSKEEYAFFINENKYNGDINSISKVIDFLNYKYLSEGSRNAIEKQTGIKIEPKETEIRIKPKERELTSEEKELTTEEKEFTVEELEQNRIKKGKDDRKIKVFAIIILLMSIVLMFFIFVTTRMK